ncbi:hypothetical protein Tco_0802270 [Tanacetum coccineum]|uniref:Uncharacterized protein n=1 Tax=Tanacetum coccineum TaxID=301880 RepID=A0ABQ5A1Z4_9ASTR
MESVKKLIDERAKHKREYDIRHWDRIQRAGYKQRSRNDCTCDDDIYQTLYDEDPMCWRYTATVEINVFATRQQHTEQPEFNNEGEVDQNVEQCHDTCPLPATLTDNQTTELSDQSL